MSHSIPSLPGGASKVERFIFPSAASRIGPTNDASIPQAQVELGIPEPDSDNTSPDGVSVGVAGRLRQDATSNPTVAVRIEDLQGVSAGTVTVADIESGAATVADFLAAQGARNRAVVPRYSIKRTNYDQGDDADYVGVSTSWELFQEIDATPPDAPGGVSASARGGAKLAEDRHGNLLLAVPALDGSPAASLVAIWRLQERTGTGFEHQLTIDLDADTGGNANAEVGAVTWLRRGDDLYLLCASRAPTTNFATFETFLIRGTDGTGTLSATYVGRGFQTEDVSPNEIAATDTECGVIVAMRGNGAMGPLGRSLDLRNWSDATEDAGLVQFSEFAPRSPKLYGAPNDVVLVSTAAWAVTDAGEILRSVDGGKSWGFRASPADASVNLIGSVRLNSIAFSGSTGFAVGSFGTILKTTDSGVTWTVVRYAVGKPELQFQSAQYNSGECAKTDMLPVELYKVKMVDASRAWIVGGGGSVFYTANGGTDWSKVQGSSYDAPFLDFVVDDAASGNVLLAVGRQGCNDDGSATTGADASAVLFVNAETTTPTKTAIQSDPDGVGFVALTIERNGDMPTPTDSAAIGYVVTFTGRVYRWNGDGSTVAFTEIAQLSRNLAYGDIESPDQATGGTSGDVVVAASDRNSGVIYQATGANAGTGVAFTGQGLPDRARYLAMSDVDVGVVAGRQSLWRAAAARNERRGFSLLTLPDGAVVLACNNYSRSLIEVYRAERPSPDAAPRFILQQAIPTASARTPSLARYVDGSLVMALGKTHHMSLDDGRSWVSPSDARLALPLSDVSETVDYPENNGSMLNRRAIAEHGGGVLWSATVSDDDSKIGIHRAWHWDSGGAYYRPILQGVPLSLGVDGGRVAFAGAPSPRDVWTVRPRYGYRVSHVATDSPTAEAWRSVDDEDEVTMEWDAEDAAVADALGSTRNLWPCTYFGLFGTDFRSATFRISEPGNASSWTSKAVSVALDTGAAAAPNVVSPPAQSSILYVSGKTWTPGQWAPGPRVYYVAFTAQDVAYRITGNGADWLEIEGVADLSGDSANRAITIYGDRICWRGDSGTGVGSAGLLGTAYGFGRKLQAIVSAQATPGGFFTVGRAFFGVEVANDSVARSFLYGLAFRPIANTEQDVSRGGIKSIRHYGRTGRVWEATYSQETPDKVTRIIGPLLAQMREPFVIMWDGSDANTSTLVRLVDAPEIQNTQGNLWDVRMILEEVG